MSRNFEITRSPIPQNRKGRYRNGSDDPIPVGAPVQVPDGATPDVKGRLGFELATGAQAPRQGLSGIAVYEEPYEGFYGRDPVTTTYSDLDTVPAGKQCQLVAGTEVKVLLRNNTGRTFLNEDRDGRVMVAGLGATATLEVGDLLTPGDGDDEAGYWAETNDEANAWLRVTAVNADRGEVEAEVLF